MSDGSSLNMRCTAGTYIDWVILITDCNKPYLLKYLLENKSIVLERDRIMEHVWGTDYIGESRTLDMHIKTLRQKIGDYGTRIRTVRNVGYVIE